MKRQVRKARFPRLREIRETQLGWEVADILSKLNGKPSAATLYRLEQGLSIRATSARRVFDLVNKELGSTLHADDELKFEDA